MKMEDNENKANENKESKTEPINNAEGSEPETTSLYERTNNATERLEKANAKTEELLNRQEQLYEKQKLGGRAEAGSPPPAEKVETDKEYRARIDKEISEGKYNK